MTVSEVKTPDHRARCVACGLRFGDDQLPGPYVDLGVFDGPTENLGDLRTYDHDVVLVCGGCLRKAAEILPEFSAEQNRLAIELRRAERARDEAVAMANAQAKIVSERLDRVAPIDLGALSKDELRSEAKRLGIDLGPGNHSKEKLLDLIRAVVG